MSARAGVVYLVGAGPGDPGLMTVRALELIASADAIYHDRLIPPGALDGARAEAELVYVGKAPGAPAVPQEEIEQRLVEAAQAGKSVVRLKGGDPFVFGRGGEEGEALRAAGVEFEVVPGVTAGVAATAYAGIPVTHRDDASAVAFVTGHEDPEKEETALDWEALARFPGTLVFYMGVKRLAENAAALIEAGRDAGEPAAAVERGTMDGQRTVVATLGTLAEVVEREGIGAPAVIVAGQVAARRESLAWLERRPLHGKRVVVTRARAQASGLAGTLRGLGAEVVELPAIRIEPRIESDEVRQAVERIGEYALICLTSPNGVHLLFEALAAAGLDARVLGGKTKKKQVGGREGTGAEGSQQGAGVEGPPQGRPASGEVPEPAGTTIAAIGPGTARALAEHGIEADVVPERFVAEALVEALADVDVEGRRVLVARAAEARDVLPEALRERGAEVDVVALYETVRETPTDEAIEAAQGADYVTFTSSSTVRNLTEALGDCFPAAARIVSIGPITSEAAREAGLTVHVEAGRHDIDGLVDALLADAATNEASSTPWCGKCCNRHRMSFGAPHRHFRLTDSTNARARELAEAGAPGGTVVTAAEQTAGRGRQGRTWAAPPGKALLYSAVLRPLDERHLLLPLAVPLAVCEAAEELAPGIECKIKWPNDVWLDERKLAGVLIEAKPQDGWAVIGVGLNLTIAPDEFPDDLRWPAVSLAAEEAGSSPEEARHAHDSALEEGRESPRRCLAERPRQGDSRREAAPSFTAEGGDGQSARRLPTPAAATAVLSRHLDRWVAAPRDEVLTAWRARDALHGRNVAWDDGAGVAGGIDDSGDLLVTLAGGDRVALGAGEVHLRL